MHEVGHTLGLRHNFKASSTVNLKDANNTEVTHKNGLLSSVMDYAPANFALHDQKQGDYFSDTIGPYDYWAIEYAYKPISGSETEELAKIAAKASAPELAYGTDEDTWQNPDPRVNRFDLGDPLEFSQHRIALVKQSLDKLQERVVAKGEGWQRARQTFAMLLGELAQAAELSSQYIGGEYTSRAHRDDPDAKLPFEPINVAKQRDAIARVEERDPLGAGLPVLARAAQAVGPAALGGRSVAIVPVQPARPRAGNPTDGPGPVPRPASAQVDPERRAARCRGAGNAQASRGLRRADRFDLERTARGQRTGRRKEEDHAQRPAPQRAAGLFGPAVDHRTRNQGCSRHVHEPGHGQSASRPRLRTPGLWPACTSRRSTTGWCWR